MGQKSARRGRMPRLYSGVPRTSIRWRGTGGGARMSDDPLDTALGRLEDEAAANRAKVGRAAEEARTAHPSDPELSALLRSFVARMPFGSAIPFVEEVTVQDPPVRRLLGKRVIPPPRSELVVRAHGWVVLGLGRKVYVTDPPNAGAMSWLNLGVSTDAEPMFVLGNPQLPYAPTVKVRIGSFDFPMKSDVSDSPLCAKSFGSITVENKCGAILETLRLHYEDLSAPLQEEQAPASATIFRWRAPAPDQAKELLAALADHLAQMLRLPGVAHDDQ
jgi:hypothetical protein